MVENALSIFPLNGNQQTTQKYIYQNDNLYKINDTGKIAEGIFCMK